MSSKSMIIQNIKHKLGELPFEFSSVTDSTISSCLNDTLREMRITDITSIDDPNMELYVEIRTEWWQLHRVRNTTAVDFRYNTASDGRAVDKSMIPKMINTIMTELNTQFKEWKRTTHSRTTGKVWTREIEESEKLAGM